MELKITLDKPIGGYWDGGSKSEFTWFLDGKDDGLYQKVGSWEGNAWFFIKKGKTDKQTLSNALRHISATLKKKGLNFKSEYTL